MTGSFDPHAGVVQVRGAVDLATADAFLATATGALTELPAQTRLTLDVGAVEFIDSYGLSALIRVKRLASELGVEVVLANVPPNVHDLLDLGGLAEYLPTV